MSIKPIKPAGRSINATPWWQHVINVLAVLAFTALMAVVLVEWAAGCGESYTDASGAVHQYECVFINVNLGEIK
jgi:hypothetical protein